MRILFNVVQLRGCEIIKEVNDQSHNIIYFDYVNNGDFNALATSHKGSYFFGIFGGAIPKLYDVFVRLMSAPTVLPEVGDPSKENFNNVITSGHLECEPKDQNRLEHSVYFFETAIHFLLFHELAHIMRGHIEYLKKKNGNHLLLETDHSCFKGITYSEMQALECDADRLATYGSLIPIENILLNVEKLRLKQTPYDSTFGLFHMWSFSISILFRTINHFSKNMASIEAHPHPSLREEFCKIYAQSEFITSHPLSYTKLKHIPNFQDDAKRGILSGTEAADIAMPNCAKISDSAFKTVEKAINLLGECLIPISSSFV